MTPSKSALVLRDEKNFADLACRAYVHAEGRLLRPPQGRVEDRRTLLHRAVTALAAANPALADLARWTPGAIATVPALPGLEFGNDVVTPDPPEKILESVLGRSGETLREYYESIPRRVDALNRELASLDDSAWKPLNNSPEFKAAVKAARTRIGARLKSLSEEKPK